MHEQSIRDLFQGLLAITDEVRYLEQRKTVTDAAFNAILREARDWRWIRTVRGLLGELELEAYLPVKDCFGLPVTVRVLLVVDDHVAKGEYSAYLYIGDREGPSINEGDDMRVAQFACDLFGANWLATLPGPIASVANAKMAMKPL